MTSHIGHQLGNYQLVRLLGEGGFAEVYLGKHIHLETEAAIKVLHTQLANDDVTHFLAEARTIAHLEHPHIVRVLDFGMEGKTPFLVMSYAPHGTLRQQHPRGVPVPLEAVVSYVKQVANALQFAHNEELIHRDIKPENMLLGRHHEVLLSDFGIAIVAQSSHYQHTLDVTGTAAYMAPEQIQGKPRPASDQYSLGVVVYEWISGERPFHGSFTELCAQHVFAPPPPLRQKAADVPYAVAQVVQMALAKHPKERFPSIQAFADALEQASASQPTPSQLSTRAFERERPLPLHPAVPPSANPTFPTALPAPSSTPLLSPMQRTTTLDHAVRSAGMVQSSNQTLQSAIGAASPDQVHRPSLMAISHEPPQPSQRGFSRRAIIAGLATTAAVAVAGGGLAWLATSQRRPTNPSGPAGSSSARTRVTILEGWRLEQIATSLGSSDPASPPLPAFKARDFLRYAQHPDQFPDAASYPILKEIPVGNSMEGFLFPGTYSIPVNATAQDVIDMMLNQLTTAVQQNHLGTLAKQNKLSVYQMVILASLVQREALFDADRPLVASVYWNRIYRPNAETAGQLDADPTVQYARDSQSATAQYWKPLQDAGRNVLPDNPWNTYTHPGFPPTPICSPGLASLLGAANPANTNYYFFLSKPRDGHNVYAATAAEFQADEQRYLG